MRAERDLGGPHALKRPSRETTREGTVDPALLARLGRSIHLRSTRLDVVYQARMEALARVRARRTAVLEELLGRLGPLLPALAEPLSLFEVAGAGRGTWIHLRALLLLGQRPPFRTPAIAGAEKPEGFFLVDDGAVLRARFTGWCRYLDLPRPLWEVDRLERLEASHVLREHTLSEVAEGLLRTLLVALAHYRSDRRALTTELHRLRAVTLQSTVSDVLTRSGSDSPARRGFQCRAEMP
jgi:hypothetical protein